jgi:hypothetical protein
LPLLLPPFLPLALICHRISALPRTILLSPLPLSRRCPSYPLHSHSTHRPLRCLTVFPMFLREPRALLR